MCWISTIIIILSQLGRKESNACTSHVVLTPTRFRYLLAMRTKEDLDPSSENHSNGKELDTYVNYNTIKPVTVISLSDTMRAPENGSHASRDDHKVNAWIARGTYVLIGELNPMLPLTRGDP